MLLLSTRILLASFIWSLDDGLRVLRLGCYCCERRLKGLV